MQQLAQHQPVTPAKPKASTQARSRDEGPMPFTMCALQSNRKPMTHKCFLPWPNHCHNNVRHSLPSTDALATASAPGCQAIRLTAHVCCTTSFISASCLPGFPLHRSLDSAVGGSERVCGTARWRERRLRRPREGTPRAEREG